MEQQLSPLPTASSPTATSEGATSGRGALAALGQLGLARVLGLGLTALGLLGFFGFLMLRVVEPDYTLLYGGLDLEDSGQIVGKLEAMDVPYQLQGGGEAILVPANQALRLRLTLAEEGLPRGGSVGDEIFDQSSALGTTSFLANVNLRRALEGELGRTITALGDVKSARVHLVLPRRELFRREQIEPSASITLRMFGNRRLDRRQVLAVQHLVAAAVPGLKPERITLVDDRGTLLARGGDTGESSGQMGAQADDYRQAYQARMKRVIEQLLERSLGSGRVHAEVSAEFDFDQITTTQETFDPEGQVVRSTQTVEEESEAAERDDDDAVTVGNNLPNAGADTAASGRASNENTTRSEETINYEISRTVRNHTRIGGQVERLSVAVLVDGRMVPNGAGEPVYTSLDDAELAEMASLVRSAIGFDEARGDVVEIKNMPFTVPPEFEVVDSWFDFTKHDLMRLIEIAVLAIIGVLLIFLVGRPAVTRLLAPELAAAGGASMPANLPPGPATPALTGPEAGGALGSPGAGDLVEVDQVTGQVHSNLIKQARDAIEQAPDDAAAVVRGWLQQG